jgi:hypothetical protein
MVGESFHPRGCWGEDSDHIRLGATVQKLLRLFAFVVTCRSQSVPQFEMGNQQFVDSFIFDYKLEGNFTGRWSYQSE